MTIRFQILAAALAALALVAGGWTLGRLTTPTTVIAAPTPSPTPCTVHHNGYEVGSGHWVQYPPQGVWACWLNGPPPDPGS